MNQPQRNPEAAFGSDRPTHDEINYRTIASQIQDMRPRALPESSYADVITLIEYMRDEALKLHARNMTASSELALREKNLAKRERELAVRQRAVDAVLKMAPRRGWFGLRRR